jgi:hypothetical protein
MKKQLGVMAVMFALLTFPARTGATTYVSNLGNIFSGGGIGDIHNVFAGTGFEGSFSTGVGSFNLNFVTLEFFITPGLFPPQSWTDVNVQLYQQVGGQTVLVGQLGNPTVNSTPTQWPPSSNPLTYTTYFDFHPLSQINLSPYSDYLVAVSGSPTGPSPAAGLLFTMQPGQYTTPANWTMGLATTSTFDGTTIQLDPFPQIGYEALKLAVDATPVPEPGATGLALLGGAALLIARPRKQLQAKSSPTA